MNDDELKEIFFRLYLEDSSFRNFVKSNEHKSVEDLAMEYDLDTNLIDLICS